MTGTISLTSVVDKSVIISGPGTASLAVDGNFTSPVFHIRPGKTVSIFGLTVTHGNGASGNGGGIYNDASNGGSATLTIVNSNVDGNDGARRYPLWWRRGRWHLQ